MTEFTPAMLDVIAERERQIDSEGWTPDHDDGHTDESLALVAALYASPFPLFGCENGESYITFEDPWPTSWDQNWDRRETFERRRRLVVAAALLLAEIERLDRAHKKGAQHG